MTAFLLSPRDNYGGSSPTFNQLATSGNVAAPVTSRIVLVVC